MNILTKLMIDKFQLQSALDYRNKVNLTNGLQYHNNLHMDYVLADCFEWYFHSVLQGKQPEDPRHLFLAAIFHDVNHSGGKTSDAYNIIHALEASKNFLAGVALVTDGVYATTGIKYVHELIAATEYPYRSIELSSPTQRLYANVLRDADLMSIYHDTGMITHDLFYELTASTGLSFLNYRTGEEKFLRGIVWNTDWARHKSEVEGFDKLVEKVVSDMDT